MRCTILCITLACLAHDLPGQSLVGTWQGYWARARDTMAVTLHLRRDSTGQYAATFDADRLRVSGIPFSTINVTRSVITMVLRGDRTTATFGGMLRADSIKGSFAEDGSPEGSFVYVRSRGAAKPPFDEREITFTNGNVRLAGTLLVPGPGSPARVPAVVFLHGSGAEGR